MGRGWVGVRLGKGGLAYGMGCMGWGKRVGMRAGWAGIGVGIGVDWVVYGCFGGMGRFGGFHPVVTELSKQCT